MKVGNSEILLVKTTSTDENDRPIYLGTVVKRHRLSKRKVKEASHVMIKPL